MNSNDMLWLDAIAWHDQLLAAGFGTRKMPVLVSTPSNKV
jgi:hypothetical protein